MKRDHLVAAVCLASVISLMYVFVIVCFLFFFFWAFNFLKVLIN